MVTGETLRIPFGKIGVHLREDSGTPLPLETPPPTTTPNLDDGRLKASPPQKLPQAAMVFINPYYWVDDHPLLI